MKSLKLLPAKEIKYVFSDIDDTMTKNGRLQLEAYEAIWKLDAAGIKVVPLTGRPAGWCELIARQWPVAGVIGENGGLYFYYEKNTMHRSYFNNGSLEDNRRKLNIIAKEVLEKVPGAAIASDQFCRQLDLAIDFAEDVKPLSNEAVQIIVSIFKAHGATAKVSSIHVNGWFGDYDKLTACRRFCQERWGLDLSQNLAKVAFVGDSPNDEPMFDYFLNSVGVANVSEFSDQIQSLPKYVTTKPQGLGFAELANHLLRS